MDIRLSKTQHDFLLQWGRAQSLESATDAAKLLLGMLLECQGDPKEYENALPRPQYRPRGWNGARVYSCSCKINPYSRSPRTRALWAWGTERGEQTMAGSFRALVDVLIETWAEGVTTEENVAALVSAIGVPCVSAA